MKHYVLAGMRFQKGMTMNEILVVLVLIGFLATAAISIGPAYIDNSTVKSAFQSVKEDLAGKDIADISNKEIKARVGKYFQVNMVDNAIHKALEVERKGRHVYLRANYEIRKGFMGNIDVVIKFENEVDLAE